MNPGTPANKVSIVANTALMVACVLLLGLTLRTLIAQSVEPIAIGIGVLSALLLLYIRHRVAKGLSAETGARAVIGIILALFTAISWTSHGFRGSIIFVAPMIPLVASLMMDRHGVKKVTVVTAFILLFMLTQHMTGVLQVDESFPEEIRYGMRAIVLLFSLVGVAWITSYYSLLAGVAQELPAIEESTDDELTGLLKKSVIDRALQHDFASARRSDNNISFALIELDGVDEVESDYGPQAAQNCLLGVAEGLRYCLRRSSDSLGRDGPWRLCILMADTPAAGAEKVARKFQQFVETLDVPIDADRTVRLTVSVGVCTTRARGLVSEEQFIDGAVAALAQARSSGGNQVVAKELSEEVQG